MKYLECNVPPEVRVHVVHLHQGNCSKNTLKRIGKTKPKYVTIAKLIDRATGEPVAEGTAACSTKDCPSRQVGRQVAVGRALAHYMEQ